MTRAPVHRTPGRAESTAYVSSVSAYTPYALASGFLTAPVGKLSP